MAALPESRVTGRRRAVSRSLASPVGVLHFLAIAMVLVVVVGCTLMIVTRTPPWGLPLIAAGPIFVGVALAAVAIRVTRNLPGARPIAAMGSAVLVGVVASLVIFSPGNFGMFGLVVVAPIAVISAAIGLAASSVVTRYPAVGAVAIVTGAVFLSVSLVAAFVLW